MEENEKIMIVMGVGFFILAATAVQTIRKLNRLAMVTGVIVDYIDADFQEKVDEEFTEIAEKFDDD